MRLRRSGSQAPGVLDAIAELWWPLAGGSAAPCGRVVQTAGAGGCWGAGGIIAARNSHASTFVLRCSLCCSLALLKFRCSGIQHQHSNCSAVLLLNCTIGWPTCLLFLISCLMLLIGIGMCLGLVLLNLHLHIKVRSITSKYCIFIGYYMNFILN
jgi:hypothetical protein